MDSYDLAIIGGGINGVAIARDAVLRGLKVILLEKDDFGSGASTKTSKLAHGGVRYLEHFEYRLVRESLSERTLLLKNAPHLVKPLPFVFPVYQTDPKPLWQIKLGLYIYDLLASGNPLPKKTNLSKEHILSHFPDLKSDGLKGGCLFYDAQMKDNRLLMENLHSAESLGANCLNYCKVTGFLKEDQTVVGIRFINPETQREGIIRAKVIVNASGAWSNELLEADISQKKFQVEPTKGVHLVIKQIASEYALLLRAPQDGRVFFVIPWEGYSLLGTTDTFYQGNPDRLSVSSDDADYLIEALRFYFPHKKIDLVSSFVGLRPLIKSANRDPGAVSRSHEIFTSASGVISVLGGKYTTYRKLAEDVVNLVSVHLNKKTICKTKTIPLESSKEVFAVGLTADQAAHILENYGEGYSDLLQILEQNPEERSQICPSHPHVYGEITYAVLYEKAKRLDDWFYRRTSIGYSECGGRQCVVQVAQKFAALLNWDRTQCQEEIKRFLIKSINSF